MSDPISPIAAAGQLLSLTSALAKLIDQSEANSNNKETLAQILGHLRAESINISQQTSAQLRGMFETLDKAKVLDKPIRNLAEDLRWYNFFTRHRLNSARDQFYEMHRVLTTFMDDVTAVLVCSGTMDSAKGAFSTIIEVKQGLDSLLAQQKPVRDILKAMIDASDRLQAQLQGGK